MPEGAITPFGTQRAQRFVVPDDGDAATFAEIPTVKRSGAASRNDGRRVAHELYRVNGRRLGAIELRSTAQAKA